MVSQLASKSEFDEAIKGNLVLVDFFATWCAPCKALSPVLEKYEKEFENVKFYKLDTEQVTEVAQEYHISSMPTLIFFKNGEIATTVKGFAPQKIKQALDELVQ